MLMNERACVRILFALSASKEYSYMVADPPPSQCRRGGRDLGERFPEGRLVVAAEHGSFSWSSLSGGSLARKVLHTAIRRTHGKMSPWGGKLQLPRCSAASLQTIVCFPSEQVLQLLLSNLPML